MKLFNRVAALLLLLSAIGAGAQVTTTPAANSSPSTLPSPRITTPTIVGGTISNTVVTGAYPAPPGLPTLPITLKYVLGPNNVLVDPASAVDAALISLAANATGAQDCTVGTDGTDTTSGGNKRFASISYFSRTDTVCTVARASSNILEQPFDIRSTDASQSGALRLKAFYANGFTATIRTTGPDPTAATWTPDGTLTNIYSAGAAWLASSATVTRVLRTDQNDAFSYSRQFVQYASKAALAAATTTNGWFWDDPAKQLWVHLAGDANVNTNKSILKVLFTDTAGNSRIFVVGAALALDGVRLEGVQFVHFDQNSRRPSTWLHNVTSLWSTAKGFDGTFTGDWVTTNLRLHASAQDGMNALAQSVTGKGLMLNVNPWITNTGELNVFAANGTYQCISAHGGSHNVLYGGRCQGANGQGLADSEVNGSTGDVSWIVGAVVGPQLYSSAGAANLQFGTNSTTGTRKVYLDTVRSVNSNTYDLELGGVTSATVYTTNTALPSIHSGSVSTYSAASPP